MKQGIKQKRKHKPAKQKTMPASYLPGSRVKPSIKKHLLPPLLGLTFMLLTLGILNTQLIAAFIYTHTYKPTSVAASPPPSDNPTDDTVRIDPNAPAKINIAKLNVDAPVIYDQTVVDQNAFQIALRSGVVHYPDTAMPGESGNVVIFGHSSGQVWAPGNYKFIFTHLDKLVPGDSITLDYEGIRYTYTVRELRVVLPTDISVLSPTPKPTLTLITCTPVGTNKKRLIVTAEQTSPKPHAEAPKPTASRHVETQSLPSNSSAGFWKSIRELF